MSIVGAHFSTEPRAAAIAAALVLRNQVSREFFDREAPRLAHAARAMADRFARGGRLLAIGHRQQATDAQHVAVEFVHPVIVGKRALPALDLSHAGATGIASLVRSDDIVMIFGPSGGDRALTGVLASANAAGALVFELPGSGAHGFKSASADPFIDQEIVEILYHTLWETVHVFLEHREAGHDLGATGFLYPYLERAAQNTDAVVADVTASIVAKARADEELRDHLATTAAETIAEAAAKIRERVDAGGTIVAFGNGGSATDANDFVLDCIAPVKPYPAVRAISLSTEPATISAIANDVGRDVIFLRQLIAHGRRGDVALAISTSGGSSNVIAALGDARRRGLLTVALLGCDGGEILRRRLADIAIVVHCDYIPRIQEAQASVYHVLIDALHQP
jgi:D-sedoheptulose 7-phosphate isomerase